MAIIYGECTTVSSPRTVIPKQLLPSVEQEEPYSLIPQWAIAVIVIGMASLLFVIVFGVAVVSQLGGGCCFRLAHDLLNGSQLQLVNRQRRSVKKQPVPLTADMLNELNKNHMGGVENYGQEELYNQEDTWSDNKLAIKQKVRLVADHIADGESPAYLFRQPVQLYWFPMTRTGDAKSPRLTASSIPPFASASPTRRTAAAATSTTAGARSTGAPRRRPFRRWTRCTTTTTMPTTMRRRRPAIRRRCHPIRTH